jgi:hypothetical protein
LAEHAGLPTMFLCAGALILAMGVWTWFALSPATGAPAQQAAD